MKAIKWLIEPRDVPSLKKRVERGEVVESVPDGVAESLCAQGVAELVERGDVVESVAEVVVSSKKPRKHRGGTAS